MARFNVVALLFVAQPHFAEAALVPMLFINQSAPSHSMSGIRTLSPGLKCPAGQLYRSKSGSQVLHCNQSASEGFSQTFDYTGKGQYYGCSGTTCPGCSCWDCAVCYPCEPGSFSETATSSQTRSCFTCHSGTYAGLIVLCFLSGEASS